MDSRTRTSHVYVTEDTPGARFTVVVRPLSTPLFLVRAVFSLLLFSDCAPRHTPVSLVTLYPFELQLLLVIGRGHLIADLFQPPVRVLRLDAVQLVFEPFLRGYLIKMLSHERLKCWQREVDVPPLGRHFHRAPHQFNVVQLGVVHG